MADGTARDQDDGVNETPKRNKTLSVFERIHRVVADVPGKIEYDKAVRDKQKKLIYEYVSHDAVTSHVRAAMNRHGLIAFPSVTARHNDGNRTEMDVTVTFVNVDQPDDRLPVQMVGYGVDPQDKGPGKALSYAVKMALLKVYMLNSADDLEADDIDHDPEKKRASQADQERDDARAAMEANAHSLNAALKSATTVAEIDDLQKANREFLMKAPEVTRGFFVDLIESRKRELARTAPTPRAPQTDADDDVPPAYDD